MKTAISLPDELFRQADMLANRLGKSRSEFIADALRDHLRQLGDAAVTARLDAVYRDLGLSQEDQQWLDTSAVEMAKRNPW